MLRLVSDSLAIAFAGFMSLQTVGPRTVYACSAGGDWDPVAESDVIVEGRITGWTEAGESGVPMFTPVQLSIDLQKTWKGEATSTFVDAASFSKELGDAWVGASGACGALDEDPTGAYVILGLGRSPEGTLVTNRLTTFYIGDGPAGERYETALERLSSLNSVHPPVTGSGGLLTESRSSTRTAWALAGGIVLVATAARTSPGLSRGNGIVE